MTCLSKLQQEENFTFLCKMTTNFLGMPKNSLKLRSRKKEFILPRKVVSVVARMVDNLHRDIIAKGINRDRTSVNYYEKMHKSDYRTWAEYRDLFNMIYKNYIDIKNNKKTFTDLNHLKDHLNAFGVSDCKKPKIKIRIKSGKIGFDVKVNYKNFDNKYNLINLALKDYLHTIRII